MDVDQLIACLDALVDAGAHELPVSRAEADALSVHCRILSSPTGLQGVRPGDPLPEVPSGGFRVLTWQGVPVRVLQPDLTTWDEELAAMSQTARGFARATGVSLAEYHDAIEVWAGFPRQHRLLIRR